MCTYNSFPFTLRDVARLCGITIRGGTKENENVTCPFCGRKGKMNLKYSTSQYNCPACNTGGHMLSLYAKLNGMEDCKNSEITAAIKERLNIPEDAKTVQMQNDNKDEYTEPNLKMMLRKDNVYRSFLSMLKLADMHREALYDRGLDDNDIDRWLFKSVPVCGLESIVSSLVKQGLTLKGVGGFYLNENGKWTLNLNTSSTGFIVPAHNIYGYIEGLQIRLDRPFGKQKYLWISSDGLRGGTKTEATPFFAAGSRCKNTLIITEGAFKAIIPSKYCGYSVLGIAGVNNRATRS